MGSTVSTGVMASSAQCRAPTMSQSKLTVEGLGLIYLITILKSHDPWHILQPSS